MSTVFEVTLRAAEILKETHRGTATGGGTNTLVDAGHPTRADDWYNGGSLWFISGDEANTTAIITDWTNTTHTFAFDDTSAGISAGDAYAAVPEPFTREVLVAALNNAIGDYGKIESSEDITAVADTYSYDLTSAAESQIMRVTTIASGATQENEFFWWKAQGGHLLIDANLPAVGDTMRVYYRTAHARVTDDDDEINNNFDIERLAWLTVYYAVQVVMQRSENTDGTIKEVFGIANTVRSEMMMRRPQRGPVRTPHLSNF